PGIGAHSRASCFMNGRAGYESAVRRVHEPGPELIHQLVEKTLAAEHVRFKAAVRGQLCDRFLHVTNHGALVLGMHARDASRGYSPPVLLRRIDLDAILGPRKHFAGTDEEPARRNPSHGTQQRIPAEEVLRRLAADIPEARDVDAGLAPEVVRVLLHAALDRLVDAGLKDHDVVREVTAKRAGRVA